jgi:hypothetical protein
VLDGPIDALTVRARTSKKSWFPRCIAVMYRARANSFRESRRYLWWSWRRRGGTREDQILQRVESILRRAHGRELWIYRGIWT